MTDDTTPPWPPEMPIKPSLYGLVIRRETNPEVIEALDDSDDEDEVLGLANEPRTRPLYYGESVVPGGTMTAHQLDIVQAIAGGAPVDETDPGVQL